LNLWDAIHRKRPCQLARGVLLPHDNARSHIAQATQENIRELLWELLEPNCLDLTPTDFDLFGPLKNHLGGKGFADDKEVDVEVLGQQPEDFCAVGFDALVK
jgi:hypothetical protein